MVLFGSGRKAGTFRFFSVLLLLLFLAGCVRSGKETYFKGDKALSQGKFQEAYRAFLQVVEEGGSSQWVARSLLKLARMERVVYQRPQKALDYCRRLTQGDFPREYKRRALLLMAEIQAEDLDRPLEGLKTLEGMGPIPGDLTRERLMVEYAIKAGDLKKAALLAKTFLEKGEGVENLRFALVLADLFKSAGAFQEAEALYQRVRSEGKGDLAHEATLGLAGLREDEKRLRDALSLLRDLQKDGYKPRLIEVKIKHIKRRLREERG